MAENLLDLSNLQKTLIDMQASGDVFRKDLSETCYQNPDFQGRPQSQPDESQTFFNKRGKTVHAFPVMVDFRRLMQLGTTECMIKGISNQDLLHAVIALYDVCLSEMTPDVLYATVCDKWARTVVLIRDISESKESMNNAQHNPDKSTEDLEVKTTSLINEETDTYEGEDATPSVFTDVFSDEEAEEDDEEEESDDEDFSRGIGMFIKSVLERRQKLKQQEGPVQAEQVGIEKRLLACATFEKKFVRSKDRVIHLTLVSVRPRYRGYGLGKYLLSQVVDPTVVGNCEAVVVHADNSAVEFFRKYGFSDDIVLNSRWSELAEQFTNCTLMCFLPAFTGASLINVSKAVGTEMIELESDFNKWKDKTLEAYQSQVSCVMRMKHEIIQLKNIVQSQSTLLTNLALENEKLRKEKMTIEKDFIALQLTTPTAAFQNKNVPDIDYNKDGEGEITTDELICHLQQQVDRMDTSFKTRNLHIVNPEKNVGNKNKVRIPGDSDYISFPCARVQSQQDLHYHTPDAIMFYDITQQFQEGMRADRSIKTTYEVTTVTKALLPDSVKEAYQSRLNHLVDGSMVTGLYYCGSLERPERIQDILNSGFSKADFAHGEYGRGLYFSKYPSKAAQFSALGKLVLVEVGLGKVETITKEDRTRHSCSEGFDSIITAGRLGRDHSDLEPTLFQEYVVFDVTQVLPLSLITYQVSKC